MNINSLIQFNEPKTLTFNNPFDTKEKPLTLQVYMQGSRVERQAFREMSSRIFALMQDESNLEELNGQKNLKVYLLEDVGVEFLSKLVVDWDGMMDGSKKVPFSREVLVQVLNNFHPLANAIEAFYKDVEGNFQTKQKKI